jgi:putative redox protein
LGAGANMGAMTDTQSKTPTGARPKTTVVLSRTDKGRYELRNSRGTVIEIATEGEAFRPGELFLASIAACSAVDVDEMTSRRAEPEIFEVRSSGHKSTEGGNHYEDLTVTFRLRFADDADGDAARERVPAAVRASAEHDCTVARTIKLGTPVDFVID